MKMEALPSKKTYIISLWHGTHPRQTWIFINTAVRASDLTGVDCWKLNYQFSCPILNYLFFISLFSVAAKKLMSTFFIKGAHISLLQQLLRTARNRQILHMPMNEWMNSPWSVTYDQGRTASSVLLIFWNRRYQCRWVSVNHLQHNPCCDGV